MRMCIALSAQHSGWMFKKHWKIQGNRVPLKTAAIGHIGSLENIENILTDTIFEPQNMCSNAYANNAIATTGIPFPDEKECHMYYNNSILVDGVHQALALTNAIEINRLPNNIEKKLNNLKLPININEIIYNVTMSTHAKYADQKIADYRKFTVGHALNCFNECDTYEQMKRLYMNRLIAECEKLTKGSTAGFRKILEKLALSISVPNNDNVLQFNITGDKIVYSQFPLEPELFTDEYKPNLPNINPLNPTVSMQIKNVTAETIFPSKIDLNFFHPHTLFSFFNKNTMRNMHGSDVTSLQFQSQSLIKSFALAAARAKQLYGDIAFHNIPKPIVVQCINTDGYTFHFSVFQLNTLSNKKENMHNYWFNKTCMNVFPNYGVSAEYEGRPIADDLNIDIFKHINAFYNN